jgi:alkylation response protein AidB-like acyl-CoA dehydrogenase
VIDLRYGELEEELRATVAGMLAQQCPPARVLAGCEQPDPYDQRLWHTLAVEMGLAGLIVPERHGGAGASLREAAVVLEELGRTVAPVPYLGSAVVATWLLLAVGDRELLPGLAGGRTIAALAVPFGVAPGAAPGSADPAVRAARDRLTGEVNGVADALAADTLLVPTDAGLYAVAAGDPGLTATPVVSLDLTRPLCDLRLAGVAGRRLADPAAAAAALAGALVVGRALLASEQLGVGQWCLATTIAYLKDRYQFARPVGSFQALKHRLADCWVELTQARAVARYAVGCADADDPDLPVAAALAQAFCGPAAVRAAEECVQLHGGIGFTWEHPAHLYLKRAKSSSLAFGSAGRHRAALAALVDLPAG